MRNPLAPQHDEHRWDRVASLLFITAGVVFILVGPGDQWRGWFSGAAFTLALLFVLIYRRYTWRRTYAGRATMIAMCVTVVYTGHATLTLVADYEAWETVQALVYLLLAYAALYKIRALTRRPHPGSEHDPTTDITG